MEYDELTGNGEAEIVLDRTPFYAEGGGQVGDQGVLREPGGGSDLFTVTDTQKPVGGLDRPSRHAPRAGQGRARPSRRSWTRTVAPARCATTRRTHLLHRALRNVVGERARQAGSLVTPDYLRFDFPFDRAVTDDELRAIEDEVHRIIREDRPVSIAFMSMAEAIEGGADAFFDEKYGETVRTIRVQDYSFELCGGTHARASGQIGGFLITGERSIGSGMRRIEAVTGRRRGRARARAVRTRSERAAAAVGAQSVDAVPDRIAALQAENATLRKQLRTRATEPVVNARERVGDIDLVLYAEPFDSADRMKSHAARAAQDPPRRGHRGRDGCRRAAALRERAAGPRRARDLGRRPRPRGHAARRRQGWGTARDGPGQGLPPRRPARRPRLDPDRPRGGPGLMAF